MISILDKDLKYLRDRYINILRENENEETTKILIIIDFLNLLGYKKDWFKFEEPNMIGKSDIVVKNTHNNDILYVEVKRKNYDIKQKDYGQLSNYMDSTNTEWGIITNGNHYYLLNKSINAKAEDRIVLEYLLIYKTGFKYLKEQNNKNLKYFSYSRIFKKQSTKYFSFFREYAVQKRFDSTDIASKQYQSANFNFFEYLDANEKICDKSLLNPTRLKGYFEDIVLNRTTHFSNSTLINKCNYIVSLLKYLESTGTLSTKYFNNFTTKEFLSDILINDDKSNQIQPLTLSEANQLIDYYSKNRDAIRNILLFKLYLFICPSINTIRNLELSNFKLSKGKLHLQINGYSFELPKTLANDYINYIKYRNAKVPNSKFKYLFFSYYNKKYNQLSQERIMHTINESFNNILEIPDKRKKELNISMIQKSVITLMLNNGFSVEQISLFTDLTAKTIYDYFTDKMLSNVAIKTKKDLISSKHPYIKLL